MKFEYLPNELLFQIFQYLYLHEIVHAFKQLNNRFRLLLLSHSPYYLDHSHSTIELDFQVMDHLSPYLQSVKSLKLMNNNIFKVLDNQSFLTKYPLNLFCTQLQHLTFDHFVGQEFLSLIMLLPNFKQLKSVSVLENNIMTKQFSDQDIPDRARSILLFQIKTLKILKWNVRTTFFGRWKLLQSSEDRSTIEHYQFFQLQTPHVQWLLFHTPHLKSFELSNWSPCCSILFENPLFDEPILNKLLSFKIHCDCSPSTLQYLIDVIGDFVQLKELQIRGSMSSGIYINFGDQWKDFIENHMPQLKIFRFSFTILEKNDERQIEKFMKAFQTDFWINEKKWFVVYDYYAYNSHSYFYTTPCIKEQVRYCQAWKQLSSVNEQIDMSNVEELTLSAVTAEQMSYKSRFTHVKTLILDNLPFDFTCEPLSHFVNLTFVQSIVFRCQINQTFFFDLLKHIDHDLSIRMDEEYLQIILGSIDTNERNHLQKVSSLEVRKISMIDFIRNPCICSYFPNIKRLIIGKPLTTPDVNYLLNRLSKLTYLSIAYSYSTHESSNQEYLQINTRQLQLAPQKSCQFELSQRKFHIFISDKIICN